MDFIDLVVQVRACRRLYVRSGQAAACTRVEAVEGDDLPPETVLIPGVVDTCTNCIEHPEVVAERLRRFASFVGPERVIASTDCGFGTFVGVSAVARRVAYAKLAAPADGAALDSRAG
jgi:5-methyltetrahydropteroyltriglutamate--homocysteine methyltransferase